MSDGMSHQISHQMFQLEKIGWAPSSRSGVITSSSIGNGTLVASTLNGTIVRYDINTSQFQEYSMPPGQMPTAKGNNTQRIPERIYKIEVDQTGQHCLIFCQSLNVYYWSLHSQDLAGANAPFLPILLPKTRSLLLSSGTNCVVTECTFYITDVPSRESLSMHHLDRDPNTTSGSEKSRTHALIGTANGLIFDICIENMKEKSSIVLFSLNNNIIVAGSTITHTTPTGGSGNTNINLDNSTTAMPPLNDYISDDNYHICNIAAIYLPPSLSSKTTRYCILIATKSRLYYFIGGSTVEQVFAQCVPSNLSFVELPSTLPTTELRLLFSDMWNRASTTGGSSMSSHSSSSTDTTTSSSSRFLSSDHANYRLPCAFAWLTGSGLYYSTLSFDKGDIKSIQNGELIEYPIEEFEQRQDRQRQHLPSHSMQGVDAIASGNASGLGDISNNSTSGLSPTRLYPLTFIATEFHFLFVYRHRIIALNQVSKEISFNREISAQQIGVPIGSIIDTTDAMILDQSLAYETSTTGANIQLPSLPSFIVSDRAVFELEIIGETDSIWKAFLQRGDYASAKEYAADNQDDLRFIYTVEANEAFQKGHILQAARLYSYSQETFETVALKYLSLHLEASLAKGTVAALSRPKTSQSSNNTNAAANTNVNASTSTSESGNANENTQSSTSASTSVSASAASTSTSTGSPVVLLSLHQSKLSGDSSLIASRALRLFLQTKLSRYTSQEFVRSSLLSLWMLELHAHAISTLESALSNFTDFISADEVKDIMDGNCSDLPDIYEDVRVSRPGHHHDETVLHDFNDSNETFSLDSLGFDGSDLLLGLGNSKIFGNSSAGKNTTTRPQQLAKSARNLCKQLYVERNLLHEFIDSYMDLLPQSYVLSILASYGLINDLIYYGQSSNNIPFVLECFMGVESWDQAMETIVEAISTGALIESPTDIAAGAGATTTKEGYLQNDSSIHDFDTVGNTSTNTNTNTSGTQLTTPSDMMDENSLCSLIYRCLGQLFPIIPDQVTELLIDNADGMNLRRLFPILARWSAIPTHYLDNFSTSTVSKEQIRYEDGDSDDDGFSTTAPITELRRCVFEYLQFCIFERHVTDITIHNLFVFLLVKRVEEDDSYINDLDEYIEYAFAGVINDTYTDTPLTSKILSYNDQHLNNYDELSHSIGQGQDDVISFATSRAKTSSTSCDMDFALRLCLHSPIHSKLVHIQLSIFKHLNMYQEAIRLALDDDDFESTKDLVNTVKRVLQDKYRLNNAFNSSSSLLSSNVKYEDTLTIDGDTSLLPASTTGLIYPLASDTLYNVNTAMPNTGRGSKATSTTTGNISNNITPANSYMSRIERTLRANEEFDFTIDDDIDVFTTIRKDDKAKDGKTGKGNKNKNSKRGSKNEGNVDIDNGDDNSNDNTTVKYRLDTQDEQYLRSIYILIAKKIISNNYTNSENASTSSPTGQSNQDNETSNHKHVLTELSSLGSTLTLHDIISLLPDETALSTIHDDVVNALETFQHRSTQYNKLIQINSRQTEDLRKDIIHLLYSRGCSVNGDQKCDSCFKPLHFKTFAMFPCSHAFHRECCTDTLHKYIHSLPMYRIGKLAQSIIITLSDTSLTSASVQNAALDPRTIVFLSDPDVLQNFITFAHSLKTLSFTDIGKKCYDSEYWGMIVEELALSQCMLCSEIMIDSVFQPFVDLRKEKNTLESWTI